MNTFKKALTLAAAAAAFGMAASSQAFAWDNCEHESSYQSSYSDQPSYQPGYFYPQPSYSYQPHHQGHEYYRRGW